MTQLPLVSAKKVVKVLEKCGYTVVRQRGSHMRLLCDNRPPVTVPNYKVIDRALLLKILRDARLTAADFVSML